MIYKPCESAVTTAVMLVSVTTILELSTIFHNILRHLVCLSANLIISIVKMIEDTFNKTRTRIQPQGLSKNDFS